MIEAMFRQFTNDQLLKKIGTIFSERIGDNSDNTLFEEINTDPKNLSSSSGMKFLNRRDLLQLLYTILYPEIILIDTTPVEDIPKLINYPWSITELKTRYENRMRGDL
jgi:hypothetical protein